MRKRFKKNAKGVTLLVLVITIIVLLILAAVVANLALSDGGILDEARRAAKEWNETTDKEKSSLSKLAQEMRNARNGIYNGTGSGESGNNTSGNETGGDTADKDAQIADLENTVSNLEGTVNDLNKQLEEEKANKQELENRITDLSNQVENLEKEVEQGNAIIAEKQGEIDNLNTELAAKNEELENKNNTITRLEGTVASLNEQIDSLNTQIANLTAKQATGNATAGDVLDSKTFSNSSGVGLTGTMPNRGALNWSGSNTYYDIPAGYYSGGRIDSRPSYEAGVSAGSSTPYSVRCLGFVTSTTNTLSVGAVAADKIIITPVIRYQCTAGDYTTESADSFISPFMTINGSTLNVYGLSQTAYRAGGHDITYTLSMSGRLYSAQQKSFVANVSKDASTVSTTIKDSRNYFLDISSLNLSNSGNGYITATSNNYNITKTVSNGVLTVGGLSNSYTTTRKGAFNYNVIGAAVYIIP